MIKRMLLLSIIFLSAQLAHGYEYKLQFTPPSGARGIVVAGYGITNTGVTGVCNYYTSYSTGGRGGHTVTKHYYNVCSWDLYGNLTSLVAGSVSAPPVLSTTGYEVIYAVAGASQTGVDTRGFGFVNTPSAHYSWATPNGGYNVIGDSTFSFSVNLSSDGDLPLTIDAATVQAVISGMVTTTAGTATISGNSCGTLLPVGYSCTVTVTYKPQTIRCTASPYGYAYSNVDLALVTNAGANPGFQEGFTITGVPICDD